MTDTENKPQDEQSFINRLLDQTPNWSLGMIGTLLALGITLRIMGLDFATPINDITGAYSRAIEQQVAGMQKFDEATKRMEKLIAEQQSSIDATNQSVGELRQEIAAIRQQTQDHETRIIQLEAVSHANHTAAKTK